MMFRNQQPGFWERRGIQSIEKRGAVNPGSPAQPIEAASDDEVLAVAKHNRERWRGVLKILAQ